MIRKIVDVLFINPGSLQDVYQNLSHQYSAIEPPSLTALFATYMRRKDLSVAIIDAAALGVGATSAAEMAVNNYDPLLVVLPVYGFQPSASTQNMPAAGQIARELKRLSPKSHILMTGTHPAALPARTMQEESIDFVCSKEGPLTIYQTVMQLKSVKHDWDSVGSLWYSQGGRSLILRKLL